MAIASSPTIYAIRVNASLKTGWHGLHRWPGSRRRPGRYGGKPAIVAENKLEQKFKVAAPDQVWVTDITYIKTYEGWLSCASSSTYSHVVSSAGPPNPE